MMGKKKASHKMPSSLPLPSKGKYKRSLLQRKKNNYKVNKRKRGEKRKKRERHT